MLAALAVAKKFKKHAEFDKFKGVNGMIFLIIRSPLWLGRPIRLPFLQT